MGAPRPSLPKMQLAEARKRDALELRLRGHSYQDIGEALGITLEGARQCVKKAMTRIREEAAETAIEVREQEAARLDRMLLRLESLAEQAGDDVTSVLAIQDRMVRIQDRRAKLLGLDLQRLEVTGANGGAIQIAAIQRVIVDPGHVVVDVTPQEKKPLELPDNISNAVEVFDCMESSYEPVE